MSPERKRPVSSINDKIAKLSKIRKSGNFKSFVHSKVNSELHHIRLSLMKKGTTSYVKDAINAELGRRYLEKEYAWYLKTPKQKYSANEKLPKIVWWCWLQGLDKAPSMVKMCLSSIKKNFKDYQINIITWDNLNDYIDIPDYIVRKFKIGVIPYAQLSDIIRILLLVKHGGVWIDSTVYCSNSDILSIIEEQDFFVYKNGLLGNDQDIKLSNWFIASKPNGLFVTEIKDLLLNYWANHDYLENYFIFHLFFTLVSEKYPEEWKKIPAFNNVSPHMMARELNDKFSQKRYEQLNSFSSMHKLNHHIELNAQGDTLYRHLLDENNINLR